MCIRDRSRGIIIADTKFEFGLDEEGNIVLGDEMLTPDSSRFWPLEGYKPGQSQPSYDKQFVRDWLKANPDSDFLDVYKRQEHAGDFEAGRNSLHFLHRAYIFKEFVAFV